MNIILLAIVGINLVGALFCADGILAEIKRRNVSGHVVAHLPAAVSSFDEGYAHKA